MNTATTNEIEHIKEVLPHLSETALHELDSFVDYLVDREKRRKALEERVLKTIDNPQPIECKTDEEFIQVILESDDED